MILVGVDRQIICYKSPHGLLVILNINVAYNKSTRRPQLKLFGSVKF